MPSRPLPAWRLCLVLVLLAGSTLTHCNDALSNKTDGDGHHFQEVSFESKIVGPDSVFINSGYGSNALLQPQVRNGDPGVCTGTLIAPDRVLTQFQCCHNRHDNIFAMVVTIGSYSVVDTTIVNNPQDSTPRPQLVYSNRFYYMRNALAAVAAGVLDSGYEICIVHLNQPVPGITPARLVTDLTTPVNPKHPLPNGAGVFIYGWGVQNGTDHEALVSSLKGLLTHTVNCSSGVAGPAQQTLDGKWPNGAPKFLCLGASATIGGPCTSDIGGPMLVRDVVYGIYSTRYLVVNEGSCLEPNTVKNSYINIAAPKIAAFIKMFRTCEGSSCPIM